MSRRSTPRHPARRAAAAAASACWIAIAVLSLLPAEQMSRTTLGGLLEHAIAYAGTGLLTGLARTRHAGQISWWPGLALIPYAGALELGQHLSPGRHPAWLDWMAGSSGAIIGLASAALLAEWLNRDQPVDSSGTAIKPRLTNDTRHDD